jgi:predicted DNA binding protein
VSTTHDFCDEYDIDLEFERIYQLSDSFRRGQYGLSENQYEALLQGYKHGYYEVPRSIELQELAGTLGVSHQSLSEQFRRGHSNLIANTLYPDDVETNL